MGLKVDNELKVYTEDIKDFDESILTELYVINKEMWIMESRITEAESNKAKGNLYMKLRRLSLARSKIKNQITEKYGGFEELKQY